MSDRPPFDVVRAAFYLVAFILVAHIVVVLIAVGICAFNAQAIVEGRWKCDADGHLFELLGAALSAALAFAGGLMRGSGPPPPPPPKL
jgi:cytochrome c oxidase assembly factor CtaG